MAQKDLPRQTNHVRKNLKKGSRTQDSNRKKKNSGSRQKQIEDADEFVE